MSRDDSGSDPFSMGQASILRVTPKALLVLTEDGEERWVPKSVIHDDSEVFDEGHEGELIVQQWWAEKELSA